MIIKLNREELKVLFLREQDLDLLKSLRVQLIELETLPSIQKVSSDDCLDWLEYQRSVEQQYSGFKVTTYEPSSENVKGNYNRTGSLYLTKYNAVLNSDVKRTIGKRHYTYSVNGVLFVLSTDNTVNDNMFTESYGELPDAIYRATLLKASNFSFYHGDNGNLLNTVKQRGYVDAGFILSKVVA